MNYTQQYIADCLGMSRQQYSNIENGKTQRISDENRRRLAELLGMPEDLVDNLDVVVYDKQEGEHYKATNTASIDMVDAKLLESIVEQNKLLLQLLQKLNDKWP